MTSKNYFEDETLNEMIEHYGLENIPNPEFYPIRFRFLVKSFEHYKRMKSHEHGKED